LMILLYVYIAVMIVMGFLYKDVVINLPENVTTILPKAPPDGPLLP
jgi:hypothetical protein